MRGVRNPECASRPITRLLAQHTTHRHTQQSNDDTTATKRKQETTSTAERLASSFFLFVILVHPFTLAPSLLLLPQRQGKLRGRGGPWLFGWVGGRVSWGRWVGGVGGRTSTRKYSCAKASSAEGREEGLRERREERRASSSGRKEGRRRFSSGGGWGVMLYLGLDGWVGGWVDKERWREMRRQWMSGWIRGEGVGGKE